MDYTAGMGDQMKRRFTLAYIALLFAATVVGFFSIVGVLVLCKRDAIWFGDELFQYANYLLYYGRTFREAVRSLFSGGGFAFPTYTLSNGYGMDTYTLLGGTICDPFTLPCLVCPYKYMEYCYVGVILLRLLFGSYAFSYYCLRRGNSYGASFVATLCYTFSGYLVFQGAIRHPFFLTTTAFFPLILAGIDKVFDGESPKLFVCAMAIQVIAAMYLAYMVCLAMLGYCIVRYFGGVRDRSVSDFVKLVLKFVVLLLLAFCIAGITVVPRVTTIMAQKRLGLTRYTYVLYALADYLRMPMGLMSVTSSNPALYFGAVGIMLVIVFVVCKRRFALREWVVNTLCLLLMVAGAVIPYVSRVFNGFSYPTNRWMFIAAFCCSYIVCRAIPVLKEISMKEWTRVLAAEVLLIFVATVCVYFVDNPSGKMILGPLMLMGMTAWLIPMCLRRSQRFIEGFLAVCVLASIAVTAFFYIAPIVGTGYARSFIQLGSMYRLFYKNSYTAAMNVVEDDSLYRYSAAKVYGKVRNASLNLGTNAIDYYKGTYNQVVDDLRTELGISDDPFNIRYFGSDSRLAVEGLTGSKYYVTAKKDAWSVPHGYELVGTSKNDYQVWESSHALPLVFVTTRVIDRESYEQLSMAQKQEALLQGCVVESSDAEGLASADVKLTSTEVPCTITGSTNAKVEDGAITVLAGGASVKLTFEGVPDAETYVQMLGLDFESIKPSEIARMKGGKMDFERRIKLFRQNLAANYPTEYLIKVKGALGGKTLDFCTNRHPQYGGKHDWLVNMGYAKEAQTTITLSFSRAGRYTFDEISVVLQPVGPMEANLDTLAKGGSQDVSFDGSTLRASLTTTETSSLAVISVPYASGWSAYVDGEKAEVMHADTAFMAVRLEGKGEHTIELRYFSSSLKLGLLVSAVGVTAGIAACVVSEVRRRRTEDLLVRSAA